MTTYSSNQRAPIAAEQLNHWILYANHLDKRALSLLAAFRKLYLNQLVIGNLNDFAGSDQPGSTAQASYLLMLPLSSRRCRHEHHLGDVMEP